MTCDHALTEFCQCIPRRPPVYTAPHVELLPGRVVWRCSCRRPDGRPLLRKYRHTEPWACTPQAQVDAFRAESGCGPKLARELEWLERNFASERSEAF